MNQRKNYDIYWNLYGIHWTNIRLIGTLCTKHYDTTWKYNQSIISDSIDGDFNICHQLESSSCSWTPHSLTMVATNSELQDVEVSSISRQRTTEREEEESTVGRGLNLKGYITGNIIGSLEWNLISSKSEWVDIYMYINFQQ